MSVLNEKLHSKKRSRDSLESATGPARDNIKRPARRQRSSQSDEHTVRRPPWPSDNALSTPENARQKDQGMLRSLVRSAAIRSDTLQHLEASRRRHHEEVKDSKKVLRIGRDTHLSQRKRYVHSPSGTLRKLTSQFTGSLVFSTIKGPKTTPRG